MRWIRATAYVFGELLILCALIGVIAMIFKYASWTIPLMLVGMIIWSIICEARKSKP